MPKVWKLKPESFITELGLSKIGLYGGLYVGGLPPVIRGKCAPN